MLLRFLEFFTNIRGLPEGAIGTDNATVPFFNLESITNTNGQLLTSGFLYDQPADGFGGFTFNIRTYPGLKELADRAFDAFRDRMNSLFPSLASKLDGGESGLDGWWEAVSPARIEQSLMQSASAEAWLAQMRAIVQSYNPVGRDNSSAIGAWVGTRQNAVRAASTATQLFAMQRD